MMGQDESRQAQFMYVCLDEYIPQDHLLRKIRKTVDFSFIYDKVRTLYSPIGRRSVDPVLLIKMLLIGYLYGIPSERKLEQEVRLNLAYRWFLGLDLADPVPDHSTLSQNRRRRFKHSGIFQEIFDAVVMKCIDVGIVTGETIVTDSTHVKAYANKDKGQAVQIDKKPSDYLLELEKSARQLEEELREKHDAQGNKKRGKKKLLPERQVIKQVIKSTTDPDAGWLSRPGKPKGFHYLNHTSLDVEHGIITDIHVTAANINDFQPYVDRIKRQEEKLGLKINKVGADKGYDYPEVHYGLAKRDVIGYIAPAEKPRSSDVIRPCEFIYDEVHDLYRCPGGKLLKYKHVRKAGSRVHKVYAASAKDCGKCSLKETCFGSTARRRIISRPLFRDLVGLNASRVGTPEYIRIQRLRRIWCEGTFGLMKRQHNLGMTYKRGRENVLEHCLFSALAINLRRMVNLLA